MADKRILERLVNTHARAPLQSKEAAIADDLTARIRHPKQWILRHPLRAARRERAIAAAFAATAIGFIAAVWARRSR